MPISLGFGTELIWLAEREDQTLAEVIADYSHATRGSRHTWVGMQKLRRQKDYTFLFEVHDGGCRVVR